MCLLRSLSTCLLIAAAPVLLAGPHEGRAQHSPERGELGARQLVLQSAENMGGLERLTELQTVQITARGHEFVLSAFESTRGPQPVQYDDLTDLRNLRDERRQLTKKTVLAETPRGRSMTITVRDSAAAVRLPLPNGDSREVPGRKSHVDAARAAVHLSPERILLTALNASDLRAAADTVLSGLPYHHIAFDWQGRDIHVYLDPVTKLLYRVQYTTDEDLDFSWRMWPEVTERTTYYSWARNSFGLRYPRQWDITRNDIPYRSVLITSLEMSDAPPADPITITPDVQRAYLGTGGRSIDRSGKRSATELAPGIASISGIFYALLVRQDDRVIVMESPADSSHIAELFEVADTLYPGSRIRAGVVAARAITLYGGIRAFEGAGIPVYSSPGHQAIIARIAPDMDYRRVEKPVTIGTGQNRVTLFPAPGDHGRATLLAYFPEHRLLYTSSLLVPERFAPLHHSQRVFEVRRLIERYGIDVDRVFGMHLPPTNWAELRSTGN